MEYIRGTHNLKPQHRGCVASIGNFDGVHLGHQAIIKQLQQEGAKRALPCTLITFEPSPNEFFQGDEAPARLMRLSEKLAMFAHHGVDRVLGLPFNTAMANMSAEGFIETVLHQQLGVQHLVVGDDFRFGHKRAGDIHMLRQAAEQYDFQVEQTASVIVDGVRVSSSLIRACLFDADFARAARYLGQPYRMTGRVAHGDKRGRLLGVPTANMILHRRVSPLRGVYAVRIHNLGDKVYDGVANIGTRPTVGGTRTQLEAHIFDFDGDIYGQRMSVEFVAKVRDEIKFENLEQLKQQIMSDIDSARTLLTK